MIRLKLFSWSVLAALLVLTACAPETPTPDNTVNITLDVDGSAQVLVVSNDLTVGDVLRQMELTVVPPDQVNPPEFTRVRDNMTITIVRIVEETEVIQESIAFERRTVPNDSLAPGETRLLQAGVNGLAEVTYRISYENGLEVGRSVVRTVVIEPPQDEVVMVGSQSQLATVTVNGTVSYISGGNAWVIRQNSANRRPLTLDGGLDGRVYALSEDGRQLMFTRRLDASPEGVDAPPTPTPDPS
ncbi:MAG: hypothetical protein GYB68_00850, partial [Chloroflexi bacterium]|nr:hypothetical protein [Chloroflexota bacterium]